MNFLAHIYLSGNNPDIKIGNFIGDFVKGAEIDSYSKRIKFGILLHREIDRFTDTHPTVLKSKMRLREKYSHYSPVIVDVYFDHFLACQWTDYCDIPLLQYTTDFYQLAETYHDVFPERARHMLKYMIRDNWLYNYRTMDGIGRALGGMSRRTKFDSKMDESIEDLRNDYNAYKSDFIEFFPKLIDFSTDFLSNELI